MVFGTSVSMAGNFASVDVENVKDRGTQARTTVEYFRLGKDIGSGVQMDVQVRNARADATGALSQSLEVGASTGVGPLFVGGGIGHDFGVRQYNYGYVVGGVAQKIGPVVANAGLKYRAGFDAANPTQTLAFAGVSYPLTKTLAANVGVTRSYQDIKENAYNVGLKVSF
jgi:hypothetical protein